MPRFFNDQYWHEIELFVDGQNEAPNGNKPLDRAIAHAMDAKQTNMAEKAGRILLCARYAHKLGDARQAGTLSMRAAEHVLRVHGPSRMPLVREAADLFLNELSAPHAAAKLANEPGYPTAKGRRAHGKGTAVPAGA